MAIIFRTDGAWGSGKGSNLTPTEVDENFYDHETRIDAIEASPPEAVSIASLDVTTNQLTVTMTDSSTFGPFTLPTAAWNPMGAWAAETLYTAFDILTNDGAIYLVNLNHTSELTFDEEEDQGDGFLYTLLLSRPSQPYDVDLHHDSMIPSDGTVIAQHVSGRDWTLPGDFSGSVAYLRIAASVDIVSFAVYKNAEQIGTIDFVLGEGLISGDDGQLGVFSQMSPTEDVVFARTDRLVIRAPSMSPADATAEDLSVTFIGSAVVD
jgi:hypothetical protein